MQRCATLRSDEACARDDELESSFDPGLLLRDALDLTRETDESPHRRLTTDLGRLAVLTRKNASYNPEHG
jgi:hypothetical protein